MFLDALVSPIYMGGLITLETATVNLGRRSHRLHAQVLVAEITSTHTQRGNLLTQTKVSLTGHSSSLLKPAKIAANTLMFQSLNHFAMPVRLTWLELIGWKRRLRPERGERTALPAVSENTLQHSRFRIRSDQQHWWVRPVLLFSYLVLAIPEVVLDKS